MLWAILATMLLGPATDPAPPPSSIESRPIRVTRLAGFSTVIANHVDRVVGTDKLPRARGEAVASGVWVTLGLERMHVFDHESLRLTGGRVTDPTVAAECGSQCPAVLFDTFQAEWLTMAIESTSVGVEIPSRVMFAAHRRLPARTFIQAAYAAAETRPVQPPEMALLVASPARGLRALPFFLVPPRGLEVGQAAAALGLTIEVSHGLYVVTASDPEFYRERRARSLAVVRGITRSIKRKYPGKETVIVVPDDRVSIGEVVNLIAVVRPDFPRIVISAGQDVIL